MTGRAAAQSATTVPLAGAGAARATRMGAATGGGRRTSSGGGAAGGGDEGVGATELLLSAERGGGDEGVGAAEVLLSAERGAAGDAGPNCRATPHRYTHKESVGRWIIGQHMLACAHACARSHQEDHPLVPLPRPRMQQKGKPHASCRQGQRAMQRHHGMQRAAR